MNRESEAESDYAAAQKLIKELVGTIPNGALKDTFYQRASEKIYSASS